MKKLLFAALFTATSILSYAQTGISARLGYAFAEDFDFGFNVGIDYDITEYIYGVGIDVDRLTFSTGLEYTYAKDEPAKTIGPEVRLNIFTIPFTAEYGIKDNFRAGGGLSLNYSKVKIESIDSDGDFKVGFILLTELDFTEKIFGLGRAHFVDETTIVTLGAGYRF